MTSNMLGFVYEELAIRIHRADAVICRTESDNFRTPGTAPGSLGWMFTINPVCEMWPLHAHICSVY